MDILTSLSNERVKEWVKLQKSSKARDAGQRYIIEGAKAVMEMPGELIEEMVLQEEYAGPLPELAEGVPVYRTSGKVFKALSQETTPQGILAVARMRHASLVDLLKAPAPLLVVLDSIQDPGNAGTIIRTADAAGAAGVILTRGSVDAYNPKTVQASMGSQMRVPLIQRADLAEVLDAVKKAGILVYAGDLEAASWHYEEDYARGACFIMGNEGQGLSREALSMADKRIRIPMPGKAESLNVGIAAGILLFEAVRQKMVDKNQL